MVKGTGEGGGDDMDFKPMSRRVREQIERRKDEIAAEIAKGTTIVVRAERGREREANKVFLDIVQTAGVDDDAIITELSAWLKNTYPNLRRQPIVSSPGRGRKIEILFFTI